MKRSKSVKLVAMGTGLLLVAACEEAKVDTALFESVQQCSGLGFTAQECESNYREAQRNHINVAPKYTAKADCEADFGSAQCETAPQRTSNGGSVFMPLMAGYMMGSMLSGGRSAGQPLYKSRNDRSTFRTGDNKAVAKSVGRTKVGQSTTRTASAKIRTVSRGGFGAGARSPMRRSFGG